MTNYEAITTAIETELTALLEQAKSSRQSGKAALYKESIDGAQKIGKLLVDFKMLSKNLGLADQDNDEEYKALVERLDAFEAEERLSQKEKRALMTLKNAVTRKTRD
ncbi:MAG: hypothetical protein ACYCQJ_05180 [Nitrososphaerales archaeon]